MIYLIAGGYMENESENWLAKQVELASKSLDELPLHLKEAATFTGNDKLNISHENNQNQEDKNNNSSSK